MAEKAELASDDGLNGGRPTERRWEGRGERGGHRCSFERGIVDWDYFLRPLQYTYIWPAWRESGGGGVASHKADGGIFELLASNVHRVRRTNAVALRSPVGRYFEIAGASGGAMRMIN